jgi:N-acetylglucosaminyl-diphospho-decaprenol L-rhamnosyltransferase
MKSVIKSLDFCKILVNSFIVYTKRIVTLIDISVIIVNWNVKELLDKCLTSLHNGSVAINQPQDDLPVVEIIVVDSDSNDGSIEMIRNKYPDVKLLPQDKNVGFTRGNNIGFREAQGRYLFLLNPDTEIIDDAVTTILDYMDNHAEVGIIGTQTLNSDGSHQSTRRRFPTLATGLFESTWLSNYAPQSIDNHYKMLVTDNNTILEVDWVQGSAMLVRREVYENLGGLDEGYVMYSEEMDWCKRTKDAGWKVIYHGEAFITHHGGKSSDQVGAFKHIHFHTSKLRYFRKHHGYSTYLTLRVIILLLFAWQMILEGVKALIGHKRELRLQRVKVYWQVLRNGLKASV